MLQILMLIGANWDSYHEKERQTSILNGAADVLDGVSPAFSSNNR